MVWKHLLQEYFGIILAGNNANQSTTAMPGLGLRSSHCGLSEYTFFKYLSCWLELCLDHCSVEEKLDFSQVTWTLHWKNSFLNLSSCLPIPKHFQKQMDGWIMKQP